MGTVDGGAGGVKRRTGSHPLARAARKYGRHGLKIFPCWPGTKVPMTEHGYLEATDDPATIRAWWAREPKANIGLACRPSGVVALDVDCKPGGPDGAENLQELEVQYDQGLSGLPRQDTPSGGFHLIAADPGVELKGTLDGVGETRVRGYIMLAPSRYTEEGYPGDRYAWHGDWQEILDPPEMPEWLLGHLARRGAETPATASEPAGDDLVRCLHLLPRLGPSVADPRDLWLRVGMALHWASNGGTLGRLAWDLWSQQSEKYEEPEQEKAWSSFRSDHPSPKTTGTLVHLAQSCSDRWESGDVQLVEAGLLEPLPEGEQRPDPTEDEPAPTDDAPEGQLEEVTQIGDAVRYAEAMHGVRMHVPGVGWMAYEDGFWSADGAKQLIKREITEVCRRVLWDLYHRKPKAFLFGQRRNEADAECINRNVALAIKNLGAVRYINGVIEQLESELHVPVAELNRDPYLFNVANGTLDLRTLELRPFDPADRLTVKSKVPYIPDADTSRWEAALEDMFQGDEELAHLLQLAFCWTVTGEGSTVTQKFILAYGATGTGKSFTQRILKTMLGRDSYWAPPFSAFGSSRGDNTPHLADGYGMRAAFVDDAGVKAEWEGETLKMATGGSEIPACQKFQVPFRYLPKFSLWVAVNDLPIMRGIGNKAAIFRRMIVIPFMRKFTTDPDLIAQGLASRKDQALEDWLRDPNGGAPSVLAWAMRGMSEYLQLRDLPEPTASKEAMEMYEQDASDPYEVFFEDHIEWAPSTHHSVVSDFELATCDLRTAFITWCSREDYDRLGSSSKTMRARLRAYKTAHPDRCRFMQDSNHIVSRTDGRKVRGVRGVRLNHAGMKLLRDRDWGGD